MKEKKKKVMNSEHDWYCWYCGDKIGDKFVLWSLNNRIDRVFIICSKENCFEMLHYSDGIKYIIKGKKI